MSPHEAAAAAASIGGSDLASFQSYQDTDFQSLSEGGAAGGGGGGGAVQTAVHYPPLELHALLEWLLNIRWVDQPDPQPDTSIQSKYLAAFHFNPYVKRFDGARDGGKWNPLDTTTYGLPISLTEYIQAVQDTSKPPNDSEAFKEIRWLDFETVDTALQIITRRSVRQKPATPLTTMLAIAKRCSKNALARHLVVSRTLTSLKRAGMEDIESRIEAVESMAIGYGTLPWLCPEAYAEGPNSHPIDSQQMASELIDVASTSSIVRFLEPVAEALIEKSVPLVDFWERLVAEFRSCKVVDIKAKHVTAISAGIASHSMREALLMSQSFAGVFFANLLTPSLLDLTRPELADRYFGRPVQPINPGMARSLCQAMETQVGLVVKTVQNMMKHKGTAGAKATTWRGLTSLVECNISQKTERFRLEQRHLLRMPRQQAAIFYQLKGISPPPVSFNIAWAFLNLTKPIPFEKITDLDPQFPEYCRLESDGGLLGPSIRDEPRLVQEDDSAEIKVSPPGTIKFVTEIFWLTVKAVDVLLRPCLNDIAQRLQALSDTLNNGGGGGADDLIRECLCWGLLVKNDDFMSAFLHFFQLFCGMFLCAAFRSSSPVAKLHPNPALKAINVSDDLLPPSASPSVEYQHLPSSYIAGCLDAVPTFMTVATAQLHPGDSTSIQLSDGFVEMFTAVCLFLMGAPPAYVRDASVRLTASRNLLTLLSLGNRVKAQVQRTASFNNAFIPAMVTCFNDAQRLSYYMRVGLRQTLTRQLDEHCKRKEFQDRLAQYADSHKEAFEKFLHYFGSNLSWALDEALRLLSELKVREGRPQQPQQQQQQQQQQQLTAEQEAELEAAAAERAVQDIEGTRNVSEMNFEDLAGECKSLMEASFLSLSVFTEFDGRTFDFVRDRPVILGQTVLCLNSSLNSLVGPKCLTLKVSNFSKYAFRPREILALLAKIYIRLSGSNGEEQDKLVKAISAEDCFFKPQLFQKATSILRREGIVNQEVLTKFEDLTAHLAQYATTAQSLESLIQDAPEEFLDPIMSELMTDPVKLPASGVVVDRKTIERHLLSDEFDPFNRAPLTRHELIPQSELKAAIEKWISDKRHAC